MLKLELRPGESITIGNGMAKITLESKSGQVARLAIQADKSVPVQRSAPARTISKMVAERGITRKK